MTTGGSGRAGASVYPIPFRFRALLVCALVVWLGWVSRHLRPDDAFLYARYVQNALGGHRLVFNPGEPVNALTSALHTWLLLAVSFVLRGHVLAAQNVLGAACFLAAALLAERAIPLAGILIASVSYFYLFFAMESSLFLLLLLLCAEAYASGRVAWLPLLCALTMLARLEGAAMLVVVAWQLWRTRRMPPPVSFLPGVAVLLLWAVLNHHLYGAVLPQSTLAKIGQGRSDFWLPFTSVPELVLRPLFATRVCIPLLVVLAGFGMRHADVRSRVVLLVPFLVVLLVFYVGFHIPNYPWYYAPFLFFTLFFVVRIVPATRVAAFAAAGLCVCLAGAGSQYIRQVSFFTEPYKQLGLWLRDHSPPGATVAATETGTLAFYSERHVVDIIGLTTPRNAVYTAHSDYESWFKATPAPDYIVVRSPSLFPWEDIAMRSPDYEALPVRYDDVYLLRRKGLHDRRD